MGGCSPVDRSRGIMGRRSSLNRFTKVSKDREAKESRARSHPITTHPDMYNPRRSISMMS